MSSNAPAGRGAAHPPGWEDIVKELDALRDRLDRAGTTNIGFPATADFDYAPLAPFFAKYMLNNLGDPYSDGVYPIHTKPMEREVVDTVADLFGAPAGDRWGYVAGGATEGTEYALHLASTLHADAVVYHSTAAHHAVTNVIQRLGLASIPVRADAFGEIDYDDLAEQVNLRRNTAAIVVANIGTAVTEAIDDVARITEILDRCAVRRRWIHGDAALSGIPLALLDPDERPPIDFTSGIDSLVTSGHKFLGAPMPCAVVVVRNSHRLAHARAITYTGSPDTTVANSRSGLAAMVLWYAFRSHGIDGLRARAERSRHLAAAAQDALREIGWPAHRHRHAMTVSFPTPPASVTAKWVLATHGATSIIVCMPGVTAEQIDAFVADLQAAITASPAAVTMSGTVTTTGPATASATDPASARSPSARSPSTRPPSPRPTAGRAASDHPAAGPASGGPLAAAQGGAPQSRAVQGGAPQSRAVQGGAPQSRAVQGGAAQGGAAQGGAAPVVPAQTGPAGRGGRPSPGRDSALAPIPISPSRPAPTPLTGVPRHGAPLNGAPVSGAPVNGRLFGGIPPSGPPAPADSPAADFGGPASMLAPTEEVPLLAGACATATAQPTATGGRGSMAGRAPTAVAGWSTEPVEESLAPMPSSTRAHGAHARTDAHVHGGADAAGSSPDAAAPAEAPVAMGPLLPTPQSVQRQKMLRQAGLPIRL
jgi:histidine decarboxylase